MPNIDFKEIQGLGEIYNGLATIHSIPVDPVMGVLWINAVFKNIPPVNRINISPVGAHIANLTFGFWGDSNRYFAQHQRATAEVLGKQMPSSYYEKVMQVCKDPYHLLALTVLLFIEGQMKTFSLSPHSAQKVLLYLLTPIVVNREAPLHFPEVKQNLFNRVNAQIRVVLLAGKQPFVNTFHTESTVRQWTNELEAATVLLLPQIAISTEANLPTQDKTFFLNGLASEVEAWHEQLPRIRQISMWDWLPRFSD